MINVTKTFLPPLKEYTQLLERTWENGWLTNRGPMVLELEKKLKDYLRVHYLTITNNGTVPLQIALKLLGTKREIITTPFSYIATSASIIWENFTPVFVDIEEDYFTVNANKLEEHITENTSCILVTHVFGNPCDVTTIQEIATRHNLKVIYDAAHCFGVRYKGNSIFNYGHVSTCSFHATKIFHTGEGGAIFCNDEDLAAKIFYSHNFGHNGPLDFHGLGINAKISELQAAMGIIVLSHMKEIFSDRQRIVEYYDLNLDFNRLTKMRIREGTEWNYSYYPVVFENESTVIKLLDLLNKEQIFPRRYFFPSLNTVKYTRGKKMPISESIASRILCLPLYVGLEKADLDRICSLINENV